MAEIHRVRIDVIHEHTQPRFEPYHRRLKEAGNRLQRKLFGRPQDGFAIRPAQLQDSVLVWRKAEHH